MPPPQSSSEQHALVQSSPQHNQDTKYLAKYRELKQKVKDIELDNDRLQLKVLKTKKNIQRLRIERAILYERLSSMPNADPNPPPPPTQHPHPAPAPAPAPAPVTAPAPAPYAPASFPPGTPPVPPPTSSFRPPSPPPPRLQQHPFPPLSRPPPRRQLPVTLPPPPSFSPHYDWRDRDLSGPGLPPMRTRSPSSSSSYAHPMQHPFMPDRRDRESDYHDRQREYPSSHDREREYPHDRERDYPPPLDRERDRDRDRDREYPPSLERDYPQPPPHDYHHPIANGSATNTRHHFDDGAPRRKIPRTSSNDHIHVPRVQEGEAMD